MRVFPAVAPGQSLAAYLNQHGHSLRYRELARMFGEAALRTAVKRGDVLRLLPNAYVGAQHRDSAVTQGSAVNAWSSRALIGGRLTLHLLSPGIEPGLSVPIVAPHGVRMRAPEWIDVRHVSRHRTSISPQGVESVVADYAVIDAWHREPPASREELFYEAMWRKVASPRAVARALSRAPRVADRRRLERLLGYMALGATSPLEVLAQRRVFRGPAFHAFEWQGEVPVRGSVRRVDMLHRRAGLAVEFDGATWHSTPEAVQRDRERDAQLLAQGIVTLRLGYEDLTRRSRATRDLVRHLVESRLA